jgi:LL-diaminopimelate aminotransferase
VAAFRKVKTNIDSGTPSFVQDAAIGALADEAHVDAMREGYRRKRDLLCAAFRDVGFPDSTPEATLYVWQRLPKGTGSVEFCKRLLDPKVGIVATPGAWISDPVDGKNPGEGFVRFALVPSVAEVEEAGERIRAMLR